MIRSGSWFGSIQIKNCLITKTFVRQFFDLQERVSCESKRSVLESGLKINDLFLRLVFSLFFFVGAHLINDLLDHLFFQVDIKTQHADEGKQL